jgi:hypothetical protein
MAVLKNTEALLQNNFRHIVSKGKFVKCNAIFAKQRCAEACTVSGLLLWVARGWRVGCGYWRSW